MDIPCKSHISLAKECLWIEASIREWGHTLCPGEGGTTQTERACTCAHVTLLLRGSEALEIYRNVENLNISKKRRECHNNSQCTYHVAKKTISLILFHSPSVPHYFEANPGYHECLLMEESESIFLQDMGDYLGL